MFVTGPARAHNMDGLIGLVNRIQRACTVLGDNGGENALGSLWDALPSVVVVGGQVGFAADVYDSDAAALASRS